MYEAFGKMPDGSQVSRCVISKDGLTASIITYGASLQDLRLAGHGPSLVLGFPTFPPYLEYSYFGPFVGRVANRIANGRIDFQGNSIELNKNEDGRQTLHGGRFGLASKNWLIMDHGESHVTLQTTDYETENGFPGDCEIRATYRILGGNQLEMQIEATATKATFCNIAHHSYFNLNGQGDILGHQLQISADHYLPVDTNQIPTGEIKSVEGTTFDFRKIKTIGGGAGKDIDHNFCLNSADGTLQPIAKLVGDKSKIEMEISTSEPGVQVYTGKHLNTGVDGLNGRPFHPHGGIALEPQGWPDAPNNPNFPSVLLNAGKTYRQKTRFTFSRNG